jgi:hypothetical protein
MVVDVILSEEKVLKEERLMEGSICQSSTERVVMA